MFFPERQGPRSHSEGGGRYLPGAPTSLKPAVWEGRHNRARLNVGVRIIEVVDGNLPVHEDSLLRHAKADDLREEIDVILSAARASGDVVVSREWIIHAFLRYMIARLREAPVPPLTAIRSHTNCMHFSQWRALYPPAKIDCQRRA